MSSAVRVPDVNILLIAGRLTRDAEVRYTGNGRAVAQFRLASNRRYKSTASGEWQDEVTYVDVRLWGDAAERSKPRLLKGAPILVEGRLRSREWEAKDGAKRSGMEVVARRVQFLESASTGASATAAAPETLTEGFPPPGLSDPAPLDTKEEADMASDLEGVSF